jgi:hypothetical protein
VGVGVEVGGRVGVAVGAGVVEAVGEGVAVIAKLIVKFVETQRLN